MCDNNKKSLTLEGKVAPVRVTDEVADFCEKHLIHRCAVPLPLKGEGSDTINFVYDLCEFVFFFELFQFEHSLHVDGTLQTFLLDFAAHFVRLADIAVEQVGIGMTAAGAEETGPAVAAFFLVEHMAFAEVLRKLCIRHAFVQRT